MDDNSEFKRLQLEQQADAVLARMTKQHRMGIFGLVAIYSKTKLLRGSIGPALLATCLFLTVKNAHLSSEVVLKHLADTAVSVLPNLLGFLLGGYTILIGFGNIDLLKSSTLIIPGQRTSLFQMLSSIFALTIYIQIITLIVSLIVQFTLTIPAKGEGFVSELFKWSANINSSAIVIISFLLFYCILSLLAMVINIFNFAQKYHLALTEERLEDDYKTRHPNRRGV
jgi:hypothetical protein